MNNLSHPIPLSRLYGIVKDCRAVAIVETSFALPLILLVGLGGMELANLVMIHSRISQVALGVADNASRIGGVTGKVQESDINEVFTGAELQSAGLDWASKGRIILSSLEVVKVLDNKGNVTSSGQGLRWQRCMGGLRQGVVPMTANATSGIGPTGGKKLLAIDGSAVMFVEVFYDYSPMVMPDLFGERRLHYTAAFTVREARDLTGGVNGVYPSSGVTEKTC